jgi:hypothetical protein
MNRLRDAFFHRLYVWNLRLKGKTYTEPAPAPLNTGPLGLPAFMQKRLAKHFPAKTPEQRHNLVMNIKRSTPSTLTSRVHMRPSSLQSHFFAFSLLRCAAFAEQTVRLIHKKYNENPAQWNAEALAKHFGMRFSRVAEFAGVQEHIVKIAVPELTPKRIRPTKLIKRGFYKILGW